MHCLFTFIFIACAACCGPVFSADSQTSDRGATEKIAKPSAADLRAMKNIKKTRLNEPSSDVMPSEKVSAGGDEKLPVLDAAAAPVDTVGTATPSKSSAKAPKIDSAALNRVKRTKLKEPSSDVMPVEKLPSGNDEKLPVFDAVGPKDAAETVSRAKPSGKAALKPEKAEKSESESLNRVKRRKRQEPSGDVMPPSGVR